MDLNALLMSFWRLGSTVVGKLLNKDGVFVYCISSSIIIFYQYLNNEFMNEFSCTNILIRNDWWVCVLLNKGWMMGSCTNILNMKWVMSSFLCIFLSPKSKLNFWLCKGLHQCWQSLGLGINNLLISYWFFWKWVNHLGRLLTS